MGSELSGRVALVTGGSTGIGVSTAAALAAGGAAVIIASRNRERGQAAAAALADAGGKVTFVQTDVRVEEEVEHLIRQTVESHGRLDYLFNNAGVEGPLRPITEWSAEACDEVLGVNIRGVFFGIKHAVPVMIRQGGGAIVNAGSFVGVVTPIPDSIIYGATKAAVLSITIGTAAAFSAQGIRVYAVCPWVTDTPMIARVSGGQPQVKDQLAKLNPSGRIAAPADVAGAVVAMFAGTSGYNSGDAVLVDRDGATRRVSLQVS